MRLLVAFFFFFEHSVVFFHFIPLEQLLKGVQTREEANNTSRAPKTNSTPKGEKQSSKAVGVNRDEESLPTKPRKPGLKQLPNGRL
jgi:hypothetical protein